MRSLPTRFWAAAFLAALFLAVNAAGQLSFAQDSRDTAGAQALYNEGRKAFYDGNLELAERLFSQALEKDPTHAPTIAMRRQILANQDQINPQVRQLSALIVPKVEFDDASFEEALDYLQHVAEKESSGVVLPNFVIKDNTGEIKQSRVNLRLRNVPLLTALKYLTDLANAEYQVQQYAIVITPLMTQEEAMVEKSSRPEPQQQSSPSRRNTTSSSNQFRFP